MTQRRWRALNRPDLTVWNDFSADIARMEATDPRCLPHLLGSNRLLMFSDYGGPIDLAAHWCASFLFTDASHVNGWNPRRKTWRDAYLTPSGRGEMRYKDLGPKSDNVKFRALQPFLDVVDELDGLLVTVAFEQRLQSVFNETFKPTMTDAERQASPRWDAKTWERLMRITHFAGVLAAGLLRPGQHVLWVTDDDPIVANHQRGVEMGRVWNQVLSTLLDQPANCNVGTLKGAIDKEYLVRDLCAVPDLAAGAIAETLQHHRRFEVLEGMRDQGNEAVDAYVDDAGMPRHALVIRDWLGDTTRPLKRLTCAFTPDDTGTPGLQRTWFRYTDIPSEPV